MDAFSLHRLVGLHAGRRRRAGRWGSSGVGGVQHQSRQRAPSPRRSVGAAARSAAVVEGTASSIPLHSPPPTPTPTPSCPPLPHRLAWAAPQTRARSSSEAVELFMVAAPLSDSACGSGGTRSGAVNWRRGGPGDSGGGSRPRRKPPLGRALGPSGRWAQSASQSKLQAPRRRHAHAAGTATTLAAQRRRQGGCVGREVHLSPPAAAPACTRTYASLIGGLRAAGGWASERGNGRRAMGQGQEGGGSFAGQRARSCWRHSCTRVRGGCVA